jgi:hypothetical protein
MPVWVSEIEPSTASLCPKRDQRTGIEEVNLSKVLPIAPKDRLCLTEQSAALTTTTTTTTTTLKDPKTTARCQ